MKRPARQFHRRFWTVFGIVIPVVFLAILSMKQTVPVEAPSILLEEAK